MISCLEIDAEIVHVGTFARRWYRLMYVLGFAASYLIVRNRLTMGQVLRAIMIVAGLTLFGVRRKALS